MKDSACEYEVLSPWADVDPRPLKGLAPRVTDLNGKTVGLLHNVKIASKPILGTIEKKLKEKFPTIKTSWFSDQVSMEGQGIYLGYETSLENPEFQKWVKGIDAAVLAVGD